MKKILTLMAVAAMAFTACSKEESTGTGDKQVRITPTIANPALTPASMSSGTRATDTDFELNDKVGLTITMTADGSAFVANKEMSFDGTDFKTEGFLCTKMSTPPRRSSPIIPTRPVPRRLRSFR